jgi:hypothetical protein
MVELQQLIGDPRFLEFLLVCLSIGLVRLAR